MSKIFAGLIIFLLVVSVASVVQAKQSSSGFQPVTLCHHTGSATNPYVTITVDNQGQLNGHIHHSGDIIPAPAGGCPGKTQPTPTPTPTCTPTPTPTPTLTNTPCCQGGGTLRSTPTPQVLGTTASEVSTLPVTGADVNYIWIYYFLIIGSLMLTYYLKVRGWQKIKI